MKRTTIATLGITLGLATMAHTALAQSTPEAQSDFGPPRPATMQDPRLATPASGESAAPAVIDEAPAAPAVIDEAPAAPAVIDEAPAATMLEAPASPAEQAEAYATTRRAAPDREPRVDRHDPNPQTGHYLGHGLFNNWGPNDFGA